MLGDISGLERIYIVCGYTDMRKSIDGLCAFVEEQLKLDPASSSLFLFCGRRLFFASTNYLKMQRHFPKVAVGNSSKLQEPSDT